MALMATLIISSAPASAVAGERKWCFPFLTNPKLTQTPKQTMNETEVDNYRPIIFSSSLAKWIL
jgi:hypothetical protein